MASKSKLVPQPQWWKHLRPFAKRVFWKRERAAYKHFVKE